MAPATTKKRKGLSTPKTPSKRRRTSKYLLPSSSTPAPSSDHDSQEYFEALKILDERIIRDGKVEYYIDWAGEDPTGQPYEPSWQPADNATEQLIAEWESEKASKSQKSKDRGRLKKALAYNKIRDRKSRVIESSPEPFATPSSVPPVDASTPAPETPARAESPANASPIKNQLPNPLSHVEIEPRSSFDPEAFERFSQLPTAQQQHRGPTSTGDFQDEDTFSSSPAFNPRPRDLSRAPGIVLDSEGEDGSESYIPTTQEASYPGFGQSTNETNGTAQVEEDYLFLLPATALEGDHSQSQELSPAVSIPDTDPIEDSQASQLQTISREIPDTFENTEASPQQLPQSILDQESQSASEDVQPLYIASQFQPVPGSLNQIVSREDAGDRTEISNTTGSASQLQPWTVSPLEENDIQVHTPQSGVIELNIPAEELQADTAESTGIDTSCRASEPQTGVVNQIDELISTQNQITLLDSAGEAPQAAEQAGGVAYNEQFALQRVGDSGEYPGRTKEETQAVDNHEDQDIVLDKSVLPNASQGSPQCVREEQQVQPSINQSSSRVEKLPGPVTEVTKESEVPVEDQVDSLGESNFNREQNAQVLPRDWYLSTQESYPHSILPTTEKVDEELHSPGSRHDSSQESPRPSAQRDPSLSPVPQPPIQSLGTIGSDVPPRPRTPADIMSDPDNIRKSIDALFKKGQDDNPFTPSRPWLIQTTGSGTRSPSTIPDRAPVPQVATSLRTVALFNSSQAAEPVVPSLSMSTEPTPMAEPGKQPEVESAPESLLHTIPSPDHNASEEDDEDDDDDDDDDDDEDDEAESLLNDDLHLDREEYVVPLPIEGRQRSMYNDEFRNKKDILKRFLAAPQDFDQSQVAEVETVIQRLRDLETHMDLLYIETEQTISQNGEASAQMGTSTQAQWSAQWTSENSVKFRFLTSLFDRLRDRELHILLVLEQNNERLLRLVEEFFQANQINYKCPTTGQQANLVDVEGSLKVTILADDSSHVIQPPDLIICLTGTLTGTQIRRKSWAQNPDRIVPIMHLVIPRSVGHIERYVSVALGAKKRLHTILASLAQVREDIGRAMSSGTLRPHTAADEIAEFLAAREDAEAQLDWPLPSIGSIKDVIEFQSQQSQEAVGSPTPTPGVSVKRPLDEENLDPAKRMRFTPQPAQRSSSVNNEVTRISDSVPGTAVQIPKLKDQVAELQRILDQERAARKDEARHYREQEASWDKRQNDYEDLQRQYRLKLGEIDRDKKAVERLTKSREILQERLNKGLAEMRDLQSRHERLESVNLASDEEKVARITQLEKELAEARKGEQTIIRKFQSAEETLEYTKEQYRLAQDRASELQEQAANLTAQLSESERKATGEVAALKQIHMDKSVRGLMQRVKSLENQNLIILRKLQDKEEEIVRLRSSRGVGVGTRAQSVGPKTPRPGSRAASPMTAHRVANLRNA